jgi:hypothetical protein
MGYGAIADAENFRPWLHDARINGEISDFYRGRYRLWRRNQGNGWLACQLVMH